MLRSIEVNPALFDLSPSASDLVFRKCKKMSLCASEMSEIVREQVCG